MKTSKSSSKEWSVILAPILMIIYFGIVACVMLLVIKLVHLFAQAIHIMA